MINEGVPKLASAVMAAAISPADSVRRLSSTGINLSRFFSARRSLWQAYHSSDLDRLFAAFVTLELANIRPPAKVFAKLLIAARDEEWHIPDESIVRRAVDEAPNPLRLLSIATLSSAAQGAHEAGYSALLKALDTAYAELFRTHAQTGGGQGKAVQTQAPRSRPWPKIGRSTAEKRTRASHTS